MAFSHDALKMSLCRCQHCFFPDNGGPKPASVRLSRRLPALGKGDAVDKGHVAVVLIMKSSFED
jgi:hypothetical protein